MKIITLIIMGIMIFCMSCTVLGVRSPEGRLPDVKSHKNDCNMCHLLHKKNGRILLSKPISELCISCHKARVGAGEHIIGVKPKIQVEGLPLDEDGKMTCITCHDPHGEQGFNKLLRTPSFSEICDRCHKGY